MHGTGHPFALSRPRGPYRRAEGARLFPVRGEPHPYSCTFLVGAGFNPPLAVGTDRRNCAGW